MLSFRIIIPWLVVELPRLWSMDKADECHRDRMVILSQSGGNPEEVNLT